MPQTGRIEKRIKLGKGRLEVDDECFEQSDEYLSGEELLDQANVRGRD
jgi:hypothetical protein